MSEHDIEFTSDGDGWFHIQCTCGFSQRVATYAKAGEYIDLHLDLVRERIWA